MAKELHANVELKLGDKIIDLRIPKMVRKPHLKHVVIEALRMLRMVVPADFELALNDKPVKIFDTNVLDEYAFGDGDQLELIEMEVFEIRKLEKRGT